MTTTIECNKTRFHAIPTLFKQNRSERGELSDKARIEGCRGHILRIDEKGEIYCESCPARWRNEGY